MNNRYRISEEVRRFAAGVDRDPDDPILPILQANAKLEAKVELWSKAILELIELSRVQNLANRRSGKEAAELKETLKQFDQTLQTLSAQLQPDPNQQAASEAPQSICTLLYQTEQTLQTLNTHIAQANQPSSEINQAESLHPDLLHDLFREIINLRETVNSSVREDPIQDLRQTDRILRKHLRRSACFLGVAIATSLATLTLSWHSWHSQQNTIKQTESALQRLQSIESSVAPAR
jgi:uncharacterized phage infection (PIP) family protein YhgE